MSPIVCGAHHGKCEVDTTQPQQINIKITEHSTLNVTWSCGNGVVFFPFSSLLDFVLPDTVMQSIAKYASTVLSSE